MVLIETFNTLGCPLGSDFRHLVCFFEISSQLREDRDLPVFLDCAGCGKHIPADVGLGE